MDENARYKIAIGPVTMTKIGATEEPMVLFHGIEWNGPYATAVVVENLLIEFLEVTGELGYLAMPPDQADMLKEAVKKAKENRDRKK